MRNLSILDKLSIYFRTAPFMIGEGFTTVGVGILLAKLPQLESLSGFALLAIGVFFIKPKLNEVKRAVLTLKNGVEAHAKLISVSNTTLEHNSRTVKEYDFKYEVDSKPHYHSFRSAYHRDLYIGQTFRIFYLAESPDVCFIPGLYSLDTK